MGPVDVILVAQAPDGFSARRILGAAAVVWATLLLLVPGGVSMPVLLAAAGFGASVAQAYGRRCLLMRDALLLVGPLRRRLIPLSMLRRVSVGRRGPLTTDPVSALLEGDFWLPPHWSGVGIRLLSGQRLFVPASDALGLAKRIHELSPSVMWDDLSENDYFSFLAESRPDPWPKLTRSSIRSGSTQSNGSALSHSVARLA